MKLLLTLGIAFVALIAIVAVSGGKESAGGSAPASSSASSKSHAAPVGSAVRDGKFEFQVVSVARANTVSDPTNNPYMTTTAQGEFVVVTLSVRNIGDQPQNYFGDNQKVVDASGRQYGANSEAGLWMNTNVTALGQINPGNSIQVRIAFDVPPGTQPTALELHDSMFSDGVSVRLV